MAQQNNGPSTTEAPYLAPTDPRVRLVSLLSAGDTVPGATTASGTPWRFGGVPDGLAAYDNGDGTVTLLVNHEITATAGGPHDTGAASGAYVDRLLVDKVTLRVVEAQELGQHLYLYDPATKAYIEQADALSRLCSADLPPRSAFYDAASGLGTKARIFLNGEESGAEGRAFGWIATGTAAGSVFELPALGNISFENLLASPNSGERTVVISNEDATGGQLYVYLGEKQREGTDIQRAGLTNGEVYGIKASFLNEASSGQPLSGTFGLSPLGDFTDKTGAELQQASKRAGVTGWLRPEDGAWDTVDPNRYYFVTTNTLDGPSRLWALDFKDVRHPEEGGTFRALLDGTEGQRI